ncbi:MAG TPA: hypothetical protein VG735_00015 [Caulobacterales bacterium]|nr:hypothetical protein [Caulobacterales bacterium]
MSDAPLSPELLAAIRANAEMAVSELGGTSGMSDFGLNEKSVAWVEGFIERQRGSDPGALVSVLGSFLGEAIIARAGGAWMQSEQGPGVRFANNAMCFPFAKVAKQFADGRNEGESVLGFYRVAVEQIATGKI